VVLLPGGDRGTVGTVYLCAEASVEAGQELVTRWSWIVLADGRLLEIAPRGCALYDPPEVLGRGSGPFLALVAQDGALVRFEERVRLGTWEARPVRLTLGGRRWRATSTGMLSAHRLGPAPTSGWGQLGGGEAGEGMTRSGGQAAEPDVYFTLGALDDPKALGLGVWAMDICLAFGRRLGNTPAAAGLGIVEGDDALGGAGVS
jgi:hypothetical protein